MADISTSYLGLKLNSPIVVGAGTFSKKIDNIKKAEEYGAGALVIYSLFQEQIELESMQLQEDLMAGAENFAESITYFPHLEHAGPREHIMWVEKTRNQVKFPLIGSLNAVSLGNWIQYAKDLESAGCDAIELNLYSLETNPDKSAEDIENQSLDIISAVKGSVKIPVSVKLSPWYTSIANFAANAVEAGADGLVLFNRFYQPSINPDSEALEITLNPSTSEETKLPLRWIAILSSQISTDFAASTGVHSGKDAVRHLLAGASAVQVVSALYQNGLEYIKTMNEEITAWMEQKGYQHIEDFKGKLNQKNIEDPYVYERSQYIKFLTSQ